MNSHAYLMMAVVIIWVLLMTPAVAYVVNGWKTRRDDLVKYFYPHAIALYFRQFSPGTKHLVPPSSTGTYAEKDAAALRTGLKVRYRKYSGVTTLVLPVVGIALGFFVLQEPIDTRMILGTALIIGGVALVNGRYGRRLLFARSQPPVPSVGAAAPR